MAREATPQARPQAGPAEPVDPAALPPEALVRTKPSAEVQPQTARVNVPFGPGPVVGEPEGLQEVRREVKDLEVRVASLERLTEADTPPAPETGPKPVPPEDLPAILAEIKSLAERVGGLKQFSQILTTLTQQGEER